MVIHSLYIFCVAQGVKMVYSTFDDMYIKYVTHPLMSIDVAVEK